MKNIKNIIKKALLFTGSTLLLAACSLNVPPPDQFSDPDAITDVNTGRSLLTSCYLSYPHQEYEFSLLGNDFCPTNLSGKDVETQNLYNWQDKNISNLSSTVWPAYYTCISNCDVLLERIDKITTETAANYLLAETALYMGDYKKAAEYADDVIEQGDDSKIGGESYSRLWRTESYGGRIFAFNTQNSYYVAIEYDNSEGDYYAVNPAFTFTDEDVRAKYTLYPKDQNGKTRNLMGKYNMMNKQGTQPNYINRMRYAGAYFIAAEAYARDNNEQMARERINHYLQLVSADPIADNTTGDALVQAILAEKYKEFVGEGSNYFDLKRTHSDLNRLSTWGGAATAKISKDDYRWNFPIPASEYKYNNNVTQNDKWPINR